MFPFLTALKSSFEKAPFFGLLLFIHKFIFENLWTFENSMSFLSNLAPLFKRRMANLSFVSFEFQGGVSLKDVLFKISIKRLWQVAFIFDVLLSIQTFLLTKSSFPFKNNSAIGKSHSLFAFEMQ